MTGTLTQVTDSAVIFRHEPINMERTSDPAFPTHLSPRAEILLRTGGAKGATGFQVMMSITDPATSATWVPATVTTKRSATVSSLQSDKNYWFAVVAIGTKGESVMSAYAVAKAA
jgi:hypothetical protein